jgi:hypothetical protein
VLYWFFVFEKLFVIGWRCSSLGIVAAAEATICLLVSNPVAG